MILLYLVIAFVVLVGFLTRIKQTGKINEMDDGEPMILGATIALFWVISVPLYTAWMLSEILTESFI